MKTFILAIQFLTRIPINIHIDPGENGFAKSVVYFPIVGLIIGAFNMGAYLLAEKLIGGIFPLVCVLLANTAITGALHIDGIADTSDGIFSARPRDRMLEIMRDSRIGTNGTIAIIFDFLLRLAALTAIDRAFMFAAILLSPVIAKTMVVIIMQISRYAREGSGMGGLFLGKQSPVRMILSTLVGFGLVLGLLGTKGIMLFGVCLIVAMLFRSYIYGKLQGMTGDTLGAANEVIEIVFLLTIAAAGRYGWL